MSSVYLDLQDFAAGDAAIVHLVVSIISIATALVLDKCEAARIVSVQD